VQVTNKETKSTFTLTAYKNGEPLYEFVLDKTKSILGRGEKSDLKVDDSRLSFYHAFVEIVPGGVKILDLSSINGTFLNGEKVDSCFLSAGDRVNFGGLEFVIGENAVETSAPVVQDQDHNEVVQVKVEEIVQKTPELTPKTGLTVIDGEYCDITFQEDQYRRVKSIGAYQEKVDKKDYIDAYDAKPIEPILQKDKSKSLRVTVLTMGNIVSVDYVPLKGNKTVYMSASQSNQNTLLIPTLFTEERLPFLKIAKGEIKVFKPSKHQFFDLKQNKSMKTYEC
jgi:hypothetical protein